MHLLIYRITSWLVAPFIGLWLQRRLRRGKEDAARLPERLGHAGKPRPEGPLVWLHAASVGESLSILPLLQALTGAYPNLHVLVTTGTVTSGKLMDERLPQRCFHQFVPVDTPPAIRRFLRYWQPDVALMVESELWPNLLLATQRRCPVIILNARMSPRSFARWQQRRAMARRLLSGITLCMAQSENDRARYAGLGAPRTSYPGNLKFDAPALPDKPAERAALEAMLAGRPVWVAASTHPGEEEKLAAAHTRLRERFPELLFILIPRHAHRGPELKAMLGKTHTVALRSAGEAITPDTSLYLADTMGELGIFYRISGIVFMGGSLIEHGGQNPLEPARLGCALITGPHVHNFPQVYEVLHTAGAVAMVDSPGTLAAQVETWLCEPQAQERSAAHGTELLEQSAGIVARYVEALTPYLPESAKEASDAQP